MRPLPPGSPQNALRALLRPTLPWTALLCVLGCGPTIVDGTGEVLIEPLPACDEPVAGPRFALGAELPVRHRMPDLEPLGQFGAVVGGNQGGVLAADLDDDGWIDLLLAQGDGSNALFWGSAAGFEPAEDGPWALPEGSTTTLASADFTGDGRLDLAMLGSGRTALFENLGDRAFAEVTQVWGLPGDEPGQPGAFAFGDIDGDEDLDLFVGRHAISANFDTDETVVGRDRLWRNDGDRFTDISDRLPWPEGAQGAVLHARFVDLDDDADLDLVVLNDGGTTLLNSFVFENRAGGSRWVDRMPDSGMGLLRAPMGLSVRDFDENGQLDLWISDFVRTFPFAGEGGPFSFYDAHGQWLPEGPEERTDVSWSVVDLDVDADSYPEVWVSYGPLPPQAGDPDRYEEDQPDVLFSRGPDPANAWLPQPDAFPLPPIGNSRGVALADWTGDGLPDVLASQLEDTPRLWESRCSGNERLALELRQPGPNHYAIGARVTLLHPDERSQQQELFSTGRGTFSASEPALYFGLGDRSVEELRVRWPDGHTERYESPCRDCRVRIVRR